MKYIRTKDEIIDVSNMQEYEADDENGNRIFDGYGYDNSPIYYPVEDILKQADTIEELCDEFVMLRLKDELNNKQPTIFSHLDLAKSYFEIGKYLGDAIYGAIWTDKGLIYVAKMNEKGKWELL